MSIKKRVTRIEQYLKRKGGSEDPIKSISLMDLVIHIRRHLENGGEDALKKYPPWMVESGRRHFLEKTQAQGIGQRENVQPGAVLKAIYKPKRAEVTESDRK